MTLNPFLQRPSLYCSSGGCSYDTHTLLMSSPYRKDKRLTLFEDAQMFHEELHWVQHHGTSIGALLSLLKFSQEMLCINFINIMPPNELEDIIKSRHNSGRRSILAMSSSGLPCNINSPVKTNLDKFRVWWHENLIFSQLLFSASDKLSVLRPWGESISDTLTGCLDWFQARYDLHNTIPFYTQCCANDFPGAPALIRTELFDLTTRSIIESAARINELFFIASYTPDGITIMDSKGCEKSFMDTYLPFVKAKIADELCDENLREYAAPLSIFSEVVSSKYEVETYRMLSTFLVVCDIALNPPVPPLVSYGITEDITWQDLYPPYRFVKLTDAVLKTGPANDVLDHTYLSAYVDKLTDAAGLSNPNHYEFPEIQTRALPDFSAIIDKERVKQAQGMGEKQDNAYDKLIYYDYLVWMHSKMWGARKKLLPFFVCPGLLIRKQNCMDHLKHDRDFGVMHAWVRSPIIVHGTDGISNKVSLGSLPFWLTNSSAFFYALYNFVAESGYPDMHAYPEPFHPPDGPLWGMVAKAHEKAFGINIWSAFKG